MKSKWVAGLLACAVLPSWALAADGWQGYQTVADNFFEGSGPNSHMVVVLSGNFNGCGWDNAGQINLTTVGSDQYRALSEVLLVALSEGRMVSVYTNGCVNGRASVTGLKLGNTG